MIAVAESAASTPPTTIADAEFRRVSRCPVHALWAAPSRFAPRRTVAGWLRALGDLLWREVQMLHPRAGDPAPDDGAPHAPPFAMVGPQRWPLIGIFHRLKAVITDPVGMVLDYHRAYGDVFTVRIPFHFDLTYLTTADAYEFVTRLDADTARMGPVMAKVPTVGSWYPRTDSSHERLQALMLAAREFMARHSCGAPAIARLPELCRRLAREHLDRWEEEVDLSASLVALFHEASARGSAGDDLWDEIGAEAGPLLRTIVNGIDIPRAAIAVTPLRRLMPEWSATRRLQAILDRVVADHRRTGRFALLRELEAVRVEGRPLDDADLSWMLMYALWNAYAYSGSYGFWSWLDVLTDPRVRAELARLDAPGRRRFLQACLTETIRLHPVASLVRSPSREVHYRHAGRTWTLPAGGYVGVVPWVLCHDRSVYAEPDRYDPFRYRRGEPAPAVFGKGDFGCVGRQFVKVMIAEVQAALFEAADFDLLDPVPERRSRVHLTYACVPVRARVRRRAEVATRAAS